jgi:hypothetical protein
MNDLDLLRAYEPVVHYTQGELFFPTAVDGYVAASSLWELTPDRRPRQVAAAGELTAARLGALPEPPPGHTYYLRFQERPLGALDYGRWRTRPDRPLFQAAGRLARVGIVSRVLSSLFNFSLLVRGAVPGGTAAAAEIAARRLRGQDDRYVYYGRVLRQGGYTVLHYVFFFPMNDWRSSFFGINDHEADWEQCFVYLVEGADGQPQPRWVAFAAHDYVGDDLRRRWDDPSLTLVGGCHPVIYAGAGSHAAYFLPGEYVTGVEPRALLPLRNAVVRLRKFWVEKLAQGDSASIQEEVKEFFQIAFVDYARGDGVAVGPGAAHSWSPILMDGLPWVEHYRGLWGVDTEDPFGGERAPAGPKFNRDGSVRLAWYDPLAWAGLDKTPPPLETPRVLAQRIAQLAAEQASLDDAISSQRARVRELELQAGALAASQYLQPVHKTLAAELNTALGELQAQTARRQAVDESQAACRQALARIEQGDWGDPQAHLHHQHQPAAPVAHHSRLLDWWGAISGALLLAVVLLLLIYTPANWYLLVASAVLIALGIESFLRGRLAAYLLNVIIFLALVTSVILLIAFWRVALALAVLLLAAVMTRDNLRELRRG